MVELGHDVRFVSEADLHVSDEVVLAMAHEDGSIIVTEDKGFRGIDCYSASASFWYHSLPRVIRFRTSHSNTEVLNHYPIELEFGAVMVVTRGRIRVRPKE